MSRSAGASRWFRFNLWVHRWTSLVATVPFLVLCLTGSILVFRDEIDTAVGVLPTAVDAGDGQLGDSIATVRATFPDQRLLSVGIDPVGHPGVMVAVIGPPAITSFDQPKFVYVELATAKILGDETPGSTFTGAVRSIHAELLAGPVGRLVGGLIGALVVLSVLSSLVVYSPFTRRTAWGEIRGDRGRRIAQLDAHLLVGAAVVGWLVVVATTGALLGWSALPTAIWRYTELAALRAEYANTIPVDVMNPPVSVDHAIDAAMSWFPDDYQVSSVLFPHTDFTTPAHFGVLAVGASGLESRRLRAVMVDANTGRVEREVPLPWYLQTLFLAEPLHFGDYGGLPLKILWTFANFATLFITGNGAYLFFARRSTQAKMA